MPKKQIEAEIKNVEEMTLEEAKALRASRHIEMVKPLTNKQKREAFRIYWAQNKKKYGMTNKLENVLWLHLVSTKNDSPELFENGLKNFGIKKI